MVVMLKETVKVTGSGERYAHDKGMPHSAASGLPAIGQSENLNILPGSFLSGLLARHMSSNG